MPGLFDNQGGQGGGILSGFGNFFNNIAGNMDPAAQENQFRRRAYNALSQENGPQDAAILMGNPQAYGMGFQRQLFLNQLQDLQKNNPGMGLNEALYHLSNPKEQYGVNFGPPVKAGPAEVPTVYGQGGQPPHMLNVGAAPNSSQQPQPSQQPAGPAQSQSPLDALAALGAKYQAQQAGAVKAAEATATAQPDLPILQNRAQDLRKKLIALRDNPDLSLAVGGALGIKGRTGPLGDRQSNVVNDIQDANNALQGDLFTSMRTMSNGGRPPTPGAMKEMRITDLQAGRTGTVPAYKDNINKTISQIDNEYEAAWKARGAPDTYKPNWGVASASAQAPPKYPEGTTIVNRQTGERRVLRAGQWAPQ